MSKVSGYWGRDSRTGRRPEPRSRANGRTSRVQRCFHSPNRCRPLVAYDSQYPEPLFSKRPIPDAFGVALLLSPERRSGSLARLTASLTDSPTQTLDQPELEKLRSSIPAARGLPLLQSIALRRNA